MHGVAELMEYRQRSYALWQRMARRWERGRAVLWETTGPVSEWLVDRLAPQVRGGADVVVLAARRLEHGPDVVGGELPLPHHDPSLIRSASSASLSGPAGGA